MARRIRRPLGPLDLRSQAILRAVIEEYVTTAQPVGSQALVERYRLGVSSATVRNILAELETAGLLTHPHTSAGRDPDRCRLPLLRRVDRRHARRCPPVEQLMIRHQFGQVEFASEHWFRLAATTLAGLTRVRRARHAGQAELPPTSGGSTSSPSTSGWPASSSSCARARSSRPSSISTTPMPWTRRPSTASRRCSTSGSRPDREPGRRPSSTA